MDSSRCLWLILSCLVVGCSTPAPRTVAKAEAKPKATPPKPVVKKLVDGDIKRLKPFYKEQETPYSCSMASARMVIAALTGKKVSEASLRKRSRVGKAGMTVSRLAALLRGRPFRLKVDKQHRPDRALLERTLREVLEDPGAFIIARFLMDDGTTHHSPLGAFEPSGRGVFILDVDTGLRWETWKSFGKRFGTMETGFVVVRKRED